MGKHLRYRINICAERNLYHGIGMAEAVKSDMFRNPSLLNPFFQRVIDHTSLQAFEDFTR